MKFVPKSLGDAADASTGKDSRRAFLMNCVGVVLSLALLYWVLGLVADGLALILPESVEAELFQWTDWPAFAPDGDVADIADIFERLSQYEELRPLPYRLYRSDDLQPNAFAFPGGGVVVTQGLLDQVESEIGLAFVLAHELGHHQNRHTVRRLGRTILYKGTMTLLFGSGDAVTQATLQTAELSYSRGQEYEADEFGLRLIHEIYGHTEGALEFFEHMARQQDSGGSWATMASTHPLTEDRIERLRSLQRELSP